MHSIAEQRNESDKTFDKISIIYKRIQHVRKRSAAADVSLQYGVGPQNDPRSDPSPLDRWWRAPTSKYTIIKRQRSFGSDDKLQVLYIYASICEHCIRNTAWIYANTKGKPKTQQWVKVADDEIDMFFANTYSELVLSSTYHLESRKYNDCK